MTFLSLTPDSLRYALYDTWYFSHRGLGYLDNYFFCLSLMNTLLFFEWKLCLWRTNFLPQRAIFAFTWSAMLIFLLKMPHGIKVCCFQSLPVVHLVFCLTCEAAANHDRGSRFFVYASIYRTLPSSRISSCPTWRFIYLFCCHNFSLVHYIFC